MPYKRKKSWPITSQMIEDGYSHFQDALFNRGFQYKFKQRATCNIEIEGNICGITTNLAGMHLEFKEAIP